MIESPLPKHLTLHGIDGGSSRVRGKMSGGWVGVRGRRGGGMHGDGGHPGLEPMRKGKELSKEKSGAG